MQQIERGIFYEDSFLGVTVGGVVFSFGTVLVDAPLRVEDARAWRSTLINQRGGSNRLLINLDAHPDRTLGSRAMDCTILAHQKTAVVFRNRPTIFKGQSVVTGSAWEFYNDAIGMRWAAPDITFSHQMSLFWGGPEIRVDFRPGPTAGSSWVVLPTEKVVFVGDSVCVDQPPFLASADIQAWMASLQILLDEYGDYIIVAGRGGLATKKAVMSQYQFLQRIWSEVDGLVKRNAGPEAIEGLIPRLMSQFNSNEAWEESYTQRLRFGLHQFYTRHYRPSSSLETPGMEEDEQ
jgi:glyoxylase-like metal-dependent hydrolase (beta-lactamase superfamily II)